MQESDTPTTTISSMDVTSETSKKCKNPQPLDKRKAKISMTTSIWTQDFSSYRLRQLTETNIMPKY